MQESRGAADMRPNDLRNLLSRKKEGSSPQLARYAAHCAACKASLIAQRTLCPERLRSLDAVPHLEWHGSDCTYIESRSVPRIVESALMSVCWCPTYLLVTQSADAYLCPAGLRGLMVLRMMLLSCRMLGTSSTRARGSLRVCRPHCP